MKIGVMTFWWDDDNYGQILQCYALQKYLNNQGHQVFLIRYRPVMKKKSPSDFMKVFNISKLINYSRYKMEMKKYADYKGRNPRGFDKFFEKNINVSDRIYRGYDDLYHNLPDADAYIVGSDQVWNYGAHDHDIRPWVLAFGGNQKKRIAYAASFGRSSFIPKMKVDMEQHLKKFDHIGVREFSGVDLCQQMSVEKAIQVLDPTFLLGENDYESITSVSESNAVFCYLISNQPMPWDEIKKFSDDKALELYVTPTPKLLNANFKFKYVTPSMELWLGLVKSSRYVLISSFHGTVFSIINKKKFLVFMPAESEGNVRINSLLKLLNLQHRIYDKSRGTLETQLEAAIDWASVDVLLQKEIKMSKGFLANALRGDK